MNDGCDHVFYSPPVLVITVLHTGLLLITRGVTKISGANTV